MTEPGGPQPPSKLPPAVLPVAVVSILVIAIGVIATYANTTVGAVIVFVGLCGVVWVGRTAAKAVGDQ
jgi:hypothetical protein